MNFKSQRHSMDRQRFVATTVAPKETSSPSISSSSSSSLSSLSCFPRLRTTGRMMMESLHMVKQLMESGHSNFSGRPRVVFISLIHLYRCFRMVPMDVLYLSLCIFHCKESWIFDNNNNGNDDAVIATATATTTKYARIHIRDNKKSAFENLLVKIRQDKDFMELLQYKNKLHTILWLEPNMHCERSESNTWLETSVTGCVTPTSTACNWSPMSSSPTQTMKEIETKEYEHRMTPLTITGKSDGYMDSEFSTTITKSGVNPNQQMLGLIAVTPTFGGVDLSYSDKEKMKFVATSPIDTTTPDTQNGSESRSGYDSDELKKKSPQWRSVTIKNNQISPMNKQKRNPNGKWTTIECVHPNNNKWTTIECVTPNKTATPTPTSTPAAPAMTAFDMALKALFHPGKAHEKEELDLSNESIPSISSLHHAARKVERSVISNKQWESVSNFLCAFKDLITDEHYTPLLTDTTWWKWKIESIRNKTIRMRHQMVNSGNSNNNNSTTTTNSNKMTNNDKKPYVQRLIMETHDPLKPRLVRTQIVNSETMLNLMEHCNDLSTIISELSNCEGNLQALAEILHQSNPTLIPMISFDSKKYWLKCVLLNACFLNRYYDGIDYKTQIIDPMFASYELPISILCDEDNPFVYGDEFDKNCQGFVFVHY